MSKFEKRRSGVMIEMTPILDLMFALLTFYTVTTAVNYSLTMENISLRTTQRSRWMSRNQ